MCNLIAIFINVFRKLSRFPLINLFDYVVTGAFQHAVHDAEAEASFFESPYKDEVIAQPVELAQLCKELVRSLSRVIAVVEYGRSESLSLPLL